MKRRPAATSCTFSPSPITPANLTSPRTRTIWRTAHRGSGVQIAPPRPNLARGYKGLVIDQGHSVHTNVHTERKRHSHPARNHTAWCWIERRVTGSLHVITPVGFDPERA